ncbi:MAG: site-specific DNA-methyltransferase [Candidatus Hodarchaeales archaeon]|jgi:adenine-specific DNA-methyltransferase
MSTQSLKVSIQSLILSLFPIDPRAINDQHYTEILSKIQEIWNSYEIKLQSEIEGKNSDNIDKDGIFGPLVYKYLFQYLEKFQEARENHFKNDNQPLHWWPSADDVYLSNRVPAFSHTFRFHDSMVYLSLEGSSFRKNVNYSPRKKYYLLSPTPIQLQDSLIRIVFQHRPLSENEIVEMGKQPKQERINYRIKKILYEKLKEFPTLADIDWNQYNEVFSFHISLFTQKNDPIILHKYLLKKFTALINGICIHDSYSIAYQNFSPKSTVKQDILKLNEIQSWFLLEVAKLLSSFEESLLTIRGKKCLVSQTDYIISLGKLIDWVGRDFVEEIVDLIIDNDKQTKEWVDLYKIDLNTIKEYLGDSKLQRLFYIDTGHFNDDFKSNLLDALPKDPIHDLLDGYVYRSDNWYALNSLRDLWVGKVKCIYLDPPYNTGNDDFIYKDDFSRYEWMVMMRNRLELAKSYLSEDGVIIISIDDNEMYNLKLLLDDIFDDNSIGPIIVQTNPRGRTLDKHLAKTHEYLLIYAINRDHVNTLFKIPKNEFQLAEYNKIDDEGHAYRLIELRNRNPRFNRTNRPNLYYPLYTNKNSFQISLTHSANFPIEILPKTSRNSDDCWTWSKEKTLANLDILVSKKVSTGAWRIFRKNYLDKKGDSSTTKEKSIWIEGSLSNERGREQLRDLFGLHIHDYPKSVDYIERIIQLATNDKHLIMDFFAGSGTTAHAIMHSNQKNHTKNKFILIEKSHQFQDVILPRIKKLSYSYQWKNGYPLNKSGEGVFIQYQILEQPMEEVFTKVNLKNFQSGTKMKYT